MSRRQLLRFTKVGLIPILLPIWFELSFFLLQAWQALPLGSKAIHEALREDLNTRGTAKIGENSDFKKVSDLRINISDEIIEELKVRNDRF